MIKERDIKKKENKIPFFTIGTVTSTDTSTGAQHGANRVVNMIADEDFWHYVIAQIQHRWNRMYSLLFVICWSLHPKYFHIRAIRPELTMIVKKEASHLFERLFPDKDIKKFRMQLIDWNNKAYPFDFNGNWDDYLNNLQNEVPELATFAAQIMSIPPTSAKSERFWSFIANIHSPKCHQLTNKHAIKMTCIWWHIAQEKNRSNHIQNKNINNFEQIVQINAPNSNERCHDKIISNIEFNDMDNSNNNLEQFEKED
ncbi:13948_t:CDS:2, partial [Dentiscutata heterogama]